MNSLQQYIDLYTQNEELINKGSHSLVNGNRADALAKLLRSELPTRRCEDYKYTDISKVLAPDFGINLQRLPMQVNLRDSYRCRVPGLGSRLFYVVNDALLPADSQVDDAHLFVGTLTWFAERHPDLFRAFYNRIDGDSLVNLNTLLAQDGVVVYVGEGVKLTEPLQFINLAAGGVPMLTTRRLLVILEQGAEATVLHCNHAATRQQHTTNEVCEIFMGERSRLQYYSVEETTPNVHLLNTTDIVQQAYSRLEYATVTLHSGLSRRGVTIRMAGEGAESEVSGLVVADGEQHVDNNLLVVHSAESCRSDMLYKYILGDQAVGAFAGKVLVEAGAQHTDSQQTNANLCVSDQAHMYTQPMLEIYADDVKCNHGSTVGQLDDAALFYMAQRGISPEDGRLLMQQAFAWDVLERIPLQPLRHRLMRMVESRFSLGSANCADCGVCDAKRIYND